MSKDPQSTTCDAGAMETSVADKAVVLRNQYAALMSLVFLGVFTVSSLIQFAFAYVGRTSEVNWMAAISFICFLSLLVWLRDSVLPAENRSQSLRLMALTLGLASRAPAAPDVPNRQFTLFALGKAVLLCAVLLGLLTSWAAWPIVMGALFLGHVVAYLRARPVDWRLTIALILMLTVAPMVLFVQTERAVEEQLRIEAVAHQRMRRLRMAIFNYELSRRRLPPAVGNPTVGLHQHSWRVLLLPYLEAKDIYDLYRFDEPWDSPYNAALAEQCESRLSALFQIHERSTPRGCASVVAVVGPRTAWARDRRLKSSDLPAEGEDTLVLVEDGHCGIKFFEPRDLEIANLPEWRERSLAVMQTTPHRSVLVEFLSGEARELTPDWTVDDLRSWATIQDEQRP